MTFARVSARRPLTFALAGLALGCPLPFGPDDNVNTETGFGTVVVHTRLTTGGAAAGVEVYVVNADKDLRKTTDMSGNATFEQVPAGSWDVGYFESATYRFGSSARRTVDVADDKIVELSFDVQRVQPPGPRGQ